MGDDLNQKFAHLERTTYQLRDLYNHKDLGNTSVPLRAKIGVHDVLMLRLKK